MTDPDEMLVLARAKRNFAVKAHADRCWEPDSTNCEESYGRSLMALSDAEREEYLEQARHELRNEPARG